MNVLVTGDRGYIGQWLSKYLKFKGYDIADGYDIMDFRQLDQALRGIDFVIHLAAVVGEKACHHNLGVTYKTNVSGTYNVLRFCRKHGIPMLFASTCAVKRIGKGGLGYYNASKRIGELMCWMNGVPYLRFGSVYGGELDTAYLVDSMINDAKNTGRIKVFSAHCYRPIVHVEDVARAIKFTMSHLPNQFYEIASENLSKRLIAELIVKTFPAEIEYVDKEDVSYVANDFLKEQGFKYKWTLHKYLRTLNETGEKHTVMETA